MLELGVGADILHGIGWLYIALAGGSLYWVIRQAEGWLPKTLGIALVVGVFGCVPAKGAWDAKRQRDRYRAAKALFDERCKTAGERIVRRVKDVDGILLRMRPQTINDSDQYRLDDPYGRNCGGDACVALYLFDYRMIPARPGSESGLVPYTPRLYHYVDIDDTASGERSRYSKETASAPLRKSRVTNAPGTRYAVDWEDISSKEDREHWIAGGSVKVIDLMTNEVIAERRGYLMDPGQGSIAGGRSPWSWARSYWKGCPAVADHNQVFVSKILEPKQGE